jgi:GT2 family glycosyltransferase
VSSNSRAVIITVNFRQPECTLRFVSSASRLDGFAACHVLIADNNSPDDSIALIRPVISGLSNVELFPSSQNRGYFGAARWALQLYLENHDAPDWVIVCNNDIVFDEPKFLLRLFEKDPACAGILAPSITSGLTGYDANPSIAQRPSRVRMWRYRFWLSHYYFTWFQQWLSPAVRKARYKFRQWISSPRPAVSGPISVYAPHGAFLIFSRTFFEAGGFIDDGAFLYAEELRVAEMCRQLELPVIHDPELRVWHEESQSTGRMLSRGVYRHQKNGFQYALARYENSYPGLGPAVRTANKTVLDAATTRQPVPAAGERVR